MHPPIINLSGMTPYEFWHGGIKIHQDGVEYSLATLPKPTTLAGVPVDIDVFTKLQLVCPEGCKVAINSYSELMRFVGKRCPHSVVLIKEG